jgi:hypothetical protein
MGVLHNLGDRLGITEKFRALILQLVGVRVKKSPAPPLSP